MKKRQMATPQASRPNQTNPCEATPPTHTLILIGRHHRPARQQPDPRNVMPVRSLSLALWAGMPGPRPAMQCCIRPPPGHPPSLSGFFTVLLLVVRCQVVAGGAWEGIFRSLGSAPKEAAPQSSSSPASTASRPPSDVVVQPLPASQKCVFILGTGRSGSSSLADALNQLPNYFIRGEHSAAFYHLFNAYRRMNATWQHAIYSQESLLLDAAAGGGQEPANITEPLPLWPSFGDVKARYSKLAKKWRLAGFNDLHPDRVREAVRSMYTLLYGYHGPNVVSGFKEVRYGFFRKSLALRCTDHPDGAEVVYGEFSEFMRFMRAMCVDVKFILNSRSSPKAEHNVALKKMTARLKTNATFELMLNRSHTWFDRYAAEHPDHAFRVKMEDMFDPQRNQRLAARILTFVGENPTTRITFDRMPTWTTSAEGADDGHGNGDDDDHHGKDDDAKGAGNGGRPLVVEGAGGVQGGGGDRSRGGGAEGASGDGNGQ